MKQSFLSSKGLYGPPKAKPTLKGVYKSSSSLKELSNQARVDVAIEKMLQSNVGVSYLKYDPNFTHSNVPGGPGYGEQMLHWMCTGRLKPAEVRVGHGPFFIKPVDYGHDISYGAHYIEVKVLDLNNDIHAFSSEQMRMASIFAIYNPRSPAARIRIPQLRDDVTYVIPPQHYIFIRRN